MTHSKSLVKTAAAFMFLGTACLVPLATAQRAHAQNSMSPSMPMQSGITNSGTNMQNVIPPSEEVTLEAKITAIDLSTRAVTLKGPEDEKLTVIAGPDVKLDTLKVGQAVDVQYYRSVAFVVNAPQSGKGVPVSDEQFMQVSMHPVTTPSGAVVHVVKMTGTVVGIDLSSNSISVVNPSGGLVVTIDVTDPARAALLPQLKVGDTISAVVSQKLAVSITPASKRWW